MPVGEDQLQHVELTRDIANRFNKLYGDTFVLPKAIIPSYGGRIMSLDDPSVKMSKSDHPDSYVALGESAESVVNKFKRAVTDSDTQVRYDKSQKPAISNLMEIYSGFSGMSLLEIETKYQGIGYGEFKNDLGELTAEKLSLLQKNFEKYRTNENELMSIIQEGSQKASSIADKKLEDVKNKIGLL